MGKEIGIDLGTTNTVVSYIDKKNKLKSLKVSNKVIIPSAVFFNSEDEWVIGNEAIERGKQNVSAFVSNFKATMGDRSYKHQITAENGDRFKIPSKEVAMCFLVKVIKAIETRLIKEFGVEEGFVEKAVITVPAKFSSTEKEATKWAALEAGLRDVKLAAEPTAAAIAYQRESGEEGKNILVYDFGGGTFDVSILREKDGTFTEIATGGDKTLGGNKLTNHIVEFLLEAIEDDFDLMMPMDEEDFDEEDSGISEETYKRNMQAIRDAANKAKEKLSSEDEAEMDIDLLLPGDEPVKYNEIFTRANVEKFMAKDIKRTVEITMNVLEEAKKENIDEVEEIVLAGGSSQIPMVRAELEKAMDMKIKFADDVSTLISKGAATLASFSFSEGLTTIAKTNVELGIEVAQGASLSVFEKLIDVNTVLPYKTKQRYNLREDGQQRLEVKIFERDIKNYPNARRVFDKGIEQIDVLIISNLPDGLKKNDTIVEVTFDAQVDGSLNVTAEIIDCKTNLAIKDGNIQVNKESNLE